MDLMRTYAFGIIPLFCLLRGTFVCLAQLVSNQLYLPPTAVPGTLPSGRSTQVRPRSFRRCAITRVSAWQAVRVAIHTCYGHGDVILLAHIAYPPQRRLARVGE